MSGFVLFYRIHKTIFTVKRQMQNDSMCHKNSFLFFVQHTYWEQPIYSQMLRSSFLVRFQLRKKIRPNYTAGCSSFMRLILFCSLLLKAHCFSQYVRCNTIGCAFGGILHFMLVELVATGGQQLQCIRFVKAALKINQILCFCRESVISFIFVATLDLHRKFPVVSVSPFIFHLI